MGRRSQDARAPGRWPVPTDLVHPLAARARNPRATHHLGLARVQRRDPLDHLGLIGLDRHRPRLRTPPTEPGRPPVGAAGTATLILVLEAHETTHSTAPEAPDFRTASTPWRLRRHRVAAHHVQPGTALSDRGQWDLRDTLHWALAARNSPREAPRLVAVVVAVCGVRCRANPHVMRPMERR
jgi:hypothetical protein